MGWLDKLKSGLSKTSEKVSAALGVSTPEKAPAPKAAPAPKPEKPAPAKIEKPAAPEPAKPGTLKKITKALSKALGFAGLTPEQTEALEEALIAADTGPRLAAELAAEVAKGGPESPAHALADALEKRLLPLQGTIAFNNKPAVILLVGVNGSGKTTTLGKLAARWSADKKKVVVGAADTFRAGAVAQLAEWCARAKVPLIKAETDKADPAGVAYQTVEQAVKTKADIAIIDTAGRLPNRDDLMAELAKITRAVSKVLPDVKPEVWLVLDATLGQATLQHVKLFKAVAGVTGLVVTKLDSSAKGGFLAPLAAEGLPVVAIGVGEGVADLGDFNARAVAQGMAGLA
ncbi:MAG TPA: signaling recognition particle receptor family protein [Alphaproteobacteria bacterium]|nr:signaling recognition particle receptor family protein [Alphaproteobacteria bacterium]